MTLLGKIRLLTLSFVLLLGAVSAANADVVTFAPLVGANGTPYAGHVEGGWTVTPTAGSWFEAQAFGNPIPSIFAGPIGSLSTSAIRLTGPSSFTFSSVDLASNNGSSNYLFEGFVGASLVYSTGGTVPGAVGIFTTFNNPFSAVVVDRIVITLTPTGQPSSINLDNITIFRSGPQAVPEPATLLLLGSGLLGVASRLRKRRRTV